MHLRSHWVYLSFVAVLGFAKIAHAQETTEMPPSADGAPPAATDPTAGATAEGAGTTGEGTVAAAGSTLVSAGHYGLALRGRWVSVPGWFLGLFTQKNVPLSSYAMALEGFWRKRDKDAQNRTWEIVVSVGYQNMSPPDGYWLGRGKDIAVDDDLVQAKNLALYTMDAAYVIRQYFSPYFGIHYGAGLGLGIVGGKILRTSAQYDPTTGQFQVRAPGGSGPGYGSGQIICDSQANCSEALLQASQTGPDNGPYDAHRFQETSVPSALPIINLLFGLDFPIPDAKGLEFRVEGGFYDAFFLGGSMGYAF